MRISRIYISGPLAVGDTITLPEGAANHCARVLRLREGAPLILFNGEGGEYRAALSLVEKRRVEAVIEGFDAREVESPLHVVIAQAISKGERMDYTLQKSVELGASHFVPLTTERTVVNLKGDRADKRVEHWQGVVISACEQSGRNRVPEVEEIQDFKQWLDGLGEGLKLVLHHRAPVNLKELPVPQGPVILLIGPEGGLSEQEIALAEEAGFVSLCLGPRVLRTETAALTALAALQLQWGDF